MMGVRTGCAVYRGLRADATVTGHSAYTFGAAVSATSPLAFANASTRSSTTRPGLKVTADFSGTRTASPVLGLRAFRGALRFTSKTPKLRS